MKPIVKGMFARSLAGHDKGKLYVISDVQEPYVFLVDGKIRTANRPKKKKLIHVQPDYEMTDAVRDEDILNRRALLNNQVDSLYKNMLPNGRHTMSIYYNPSNEQNKGKPGSDNPSIQAPNNPAAPGSSTNTSSVQRTPFIKAGSIMYAQLDAEIDTDDGGPVMATIYGGKLAGAKLLGQVEKGNDNIRLAFRTVSPNDANKGTFGIDAVALRTEDAKQGLATSINRHTISRYSSLIFSSAWAIFIALIILLHGFGKAFHFYSLTQTEFLFIIGTLTTSIFTFYTLVLKYLFYRKPDKNAPPKE